MEKLNHLKDDPVLHKNMTELLINWVNQFHHYSHCAQAQDLSDFNNGVILCELVYDVILQGRDASFLNRVITQDLNQDRSIKNISLANQNIRESYLQSLNPHQIYTDPEVMLLLLEYLHKVCKTQEKQELAYGKPPLSGRNNTNSQHSSSNTQEDRQLTTGNANPNAVRIINTRQMQQQFQQQPYNTGNYYSSDNGDDLIEPDQDNEPACMESPYEADDNQQFRRPIQQVQQYQYDQQHNAVFPQYGAIHVNDLQGEDDLSEHEEATPSEIERKAAEFGNNQQIQENIQRMSESLGEHFRQSSLSAKNTGEQFFMEKNQEQQPQHPKSAEEFDNMARASASQTRFYQMSKMRPGMTRAYQEQMIEIPGEISNAERDAQYARSNVEQDVQSLGFIQGNSDNEKNNDGINQEEEQKKRNRLGSQQQQQQQNQAILHEDYLDGEDEDDERRMTFGKNNISKDRMAQQELLNAKNNIQPVHNRLEQQPQKNQLQQQQQNSQKINQVVSPNVQQLQASIQQQAAESQERLKKLKAQKEQYEQQQQQLQQQQQQIIQESENNHSTNEQSQISTPFKPSAQTKLADYQQSAQKNNLNQTQTSGVGQYQQQQIRYQASQQQQYNSPTRQVWHDGDKKLKKWNQEIQQETSNFSSAKKNKNSINNTQSKTALVPQVTNSYVIEKFKNQRENSAKKLKEAREIVKGAHNSSNNNNTNNNQDDNNNKISSPSRTVNLAQILKKTNNNTGTGTQQSQQISGDRGLLVLDFEIERVSVQTREKLCNWLSDIKLLKKIENLQDRLHRICKDGVLFSDIINLLEGKKELAIKGIERHVSKPTQITSNYQKIFAFLRKQDKINPRFLSQETLIQQHEQVFWAFLHDLYCFYQKKISPYDIRFKSITIKEQQQLQQQEQLEIQQLNRSQQQQYIPGGQQRRCSTGVSNGNFSGLGQIQEEPSEVHSLQQSAKKNQQNYEDIMHSSHNESKIKQQKERSLESQRNRKDSNNNTKDQGTFKAMLTDEGSPYQQLGRKSIGSNGVEDIDENDEQQQGQYQQQQSQGFSDFDIDSVRQWLRQLGFGYSLKKSQKLQEQLLQIKQEQLLKQEQLQLQLQQQQQQLAQQQQQSTQQQQQDYQQSKQQLQYQQHIQQQQFAMQQQEQNIQHTIKDPLRNGTLLCLVLSRIEMCRVDSMHRKPQNINECRSNFDISYKNIRSRTVCVSIDLLWRDKEIIFNNELSSLWQILHGLMLSTNNDSNNQKGMYNNNLHAGNSNGGVVCFSSFGSPKISKVNENNNNNNNNNTMLLNQNTSFKNSINKDCILCDGIILPYSQESLNQLKACLIQWVNRSGVLSDLQISQSSAEISDIYELINLCSEGGLLCLLISKIVQVKIVGITKRCITQHTALSNIRKFLDIFNRTKNLPSVFAVTANAIYQKQEDLIIAILEELMRYEYNVPPRYLDNVTDVPFILNINQQKDNNIIRNSNYQAKIQPERQKGKVSQLEGQQYNQDINKNNYTDGCIEDDGRNMYTSGSISGQNNNTNHKASRISLADSKSNKDLLKSYLDTYPSQSSIPLNSPKQMDSKIGISQKGNSNTVNSDNNKQGNNSQNNRSAFLRIENGYSFKEASSRIAGESVGHNNKNKSNSSYNQEEDKNAIIESTPKSQLAQVNNDHDDILQDKQSEKIKNWLTNLGFEDIALQLNFAEPSIEILKNGLAISKILSKLEGSTNINVITGLHEKPRTQAQFKHNMRKCIEFLQTKNEMAVDLLWDEDMFFECSSPFIKTLLLAIIHAYRKQTRFSARKNEKGDYLGNTLLSMSAKKMAIVSSQ